MIEQKIKVGHVEYLLENNSCWFSIEPIDDKQFGVVLFLSFSNRIKVGQVEFLSGIKVGTVA
jgi:hypothetical protein